MKRSEFIKQSNLPQTLLSSVIRQCGGWEAFQEMAQDVSNHGADSGFSGFTYYNDTISFFKRNKAAILEMAKSQADDFGSVDLYSMIAGFNCLKTDSGTVADAIHNPRTQDPENVRNALAWYALEECSRAYCDAVEMA